MNAKPADQAESTHASARAHRRLADGPASLRMTLDEVERQEILSALEQANWVVAGPHGAAALLGMKRSTLQFRIRKLGISRPSKKE